MKARVPDIYIIGAQKSGTTTLYDCLAQHPEIYAHPLAKDYPYFSNPIIFQNGKKQFCSFAKKAPKNQLVLGGDANALYAPLAPKRMSRVIPKVQLIAILRNPIERAYSAYCHAVERLLEKRSFEQAIYEELNGIRYNQLNALSHDYLSHGLYAQQLKKIYDFFSYEQVKIIIFEELKENPFEKLNRIFIDIGISQFSPRMRILNRTKGGCKYTMIAKTVHSPSPLMKVIVKTFLPFSLRTIIRKKIDLYNRSEQIRSPLSQHLIDVLGNYYRKEIFELENLMECTLSAWYS